MVTVPLERYGQILTRGKSPDFTSLVLTDHNGIILFDANDSSFIGKKDGEEIFNLLKEGSDSGAFQATEITGKSRFFAYRKLHLEGEKIPYMYVRVGILANEVLEPANSAFLFNMATTFTLMLPLFCFVLYVSKRGILDKISAIRNAAKEVAQGNFQVRVQDQVVSGELGELAYAFDTMTKRLGEDIAERKLAEEALRTSEEKFSKAFQYAPLLMTLSQVDNGTYIDVNRKFTEYPVSVVRKR